MKKLCVVLLALMLCAAMLFGCQSAVIEPEPAAEAPAVEAPAAEAPAVEEPAAEEPAAEPVELVVFAAASMTETMDTIIGMYKDVAPNVTILPNYDSSGTLKTQIQEGADCDIFISAGQKQMNQLDITASAEVNTDGLDFVLEGSRFNIVSNKVVMIVPADSAKGITSFEDVMTDKVALVALGNADVPVGQYSEEIYTSLGLWDALVASGKVSYGTNVKEVLEQVASAAVDCGVVYSTDAATAEGVTVVAEAPADSHKPIVYPAAILNVTKDQAAAEAFMEYLKSDACAAVFTSVGFSIPA